MDVSYFHGRSVVSVEVAEGVGWVINLEGGGAIYSYDPSYEAPAVEGLALTASEASNEGVKVYFGTLENPHGSVVNLRHDQYGMSDETYTQNAVVYGKPPGASEDTASLTASGSEPLGDIRTAEGPSDAWRAAEAERVRLAEKQAEAYERAAVGHTLEAQGVKLVDADESA